MSNFPSSYRGQIENDFLSQFQGLSLESRPPLDLSVPQPFFHREGPLIREDEPGPKSPPFQLLSDDADIEQPWNWDPFLESLESGAFSFPWRQALGSSTQGTAPRSESKYDRANKSLTIESSNAIFPFDPNLYWYPNRELQERIYDWRAWRVYEAVNFPEELRRIAPEAPVNEHFGRSEITPMMMAAAFGNIESMQILLEYGVGNARPSKMLDATDAEGQTPLVYAITSKISRDQKIATIKFLLQIGRMGSRQTYLPDNNNLYPIHHAAIQGDPEIIRLLVTADASHLNASTDFITPLELAAIHHHPEAIYELRTFGAIPTLKSYTTRLNADAKRWLTMPIDELQSEISHRPYLSYR